MKRVAVALMAIGAGLAGLTWWALESGSVANLETQTADGSTRATHVWYVTPRGELWLEAGTPDNAWFRDIQASPVLTLGVDGGSARFRAEVVDEAATRLRVRGLLREKYGLRDWWVGHFVDSSRSVPVRLVPTGP
jgi:hypothetical protein